MGCKHLGGAAATGVGGGGGAADATMEEAAAAAAVGGRRPARCVLCLDNTRHCLGVDSENTAQIRFKRLAA
jgi:hypothetical protein